MQFIFALLLLLAPSINGLRPRVTTRVQVNQIHSLTRLYAEEPSKGTEMVPIVKENIESVAGITGGILGLILGGPTVALGLAAVSFYVSKKDNEGGEAIRGIGKAVLESFNYVSKINNKFDLTGKVSGAVSEVVDSSDSEVVVKAKEVLSKAKEFDSQYGVVAKSKEAISAASKLSDAAFEKVEDLNAKYDFVEVAKKAAAAAAEKAKELKDKASN